eukprot:TRINITY_DN4915_c0_g1_i1.p1 TRINITY_DN4915_c0_g1~~TRINITY_DN4915_c0_g1_i1.p1  ORF type:complete len:324 (+),score=100.15 TRINITY_DN4915_c0_g1_i1:153-1124(+)
MEKEIRHLDESKMVDKELKIRRKILKLYNKRREHFNSLRAYNDYLEEIEDIIYNLTHGIDEAATNEKVEKYRQENENDIYLNEALKAQDERALIQRLKLEEEEKMLKREEMMELEKQRQNEIREKLIDKDDKGKTTSTQKKPSNWKGGVAQKENRAANLPLVPPSPSSSTSTPALPSFSPFFRHPQQNPSTPSLSHTLSLSLASTTPKPYAAPSLRPIFTPAIGASVPVSTPTPVFTPKTSSMPSLHANLKAFTPSLPSFTPKGNPTIPTFTPSNGKTQNLHPHPHHNPIQGNKEESIAFYAAGYSEDFFRKRSLEEAFEAFM